MAGGGAAKYTKHVSDLRQDSKARPSAASPRRKRDGAVVTKPEPGDGQGKAKFLVKVPAQLNDDSSVERGKDPRSEKGSRGGRQASEYAINWSETPLYRYYQDHQAIIDVQKFQQIGHDPQNGYLAWDERHFANWEVETLLGHIKQSYADYENQKVHGPLYVKALVTLKYLFDEQGIDPSKL